VLVSPEPYGDSRAHECEDRQHDERADHAGMRVVVVSGQVDGVDEQNDGPGDHPDNDECRNPPHAESLDPWFRRLPL
jgi:hypothetical protein